MITDLSDSRLDGAIYFGHVMHHRHHPFQHRFRYRVFSLYADMEALPRLGSKLRLFAYNRFGIFSFYDADHGARDGSSALAWVRGELARHGIKDAGARVRILCFPRILGYVFNPLTVYFCFDASGRLGALLYEVKNTFGEQHGYLVPITKETPSLMKHEADKTFYVSPFIDMTARYHFQTQEPGEGLHILINETLDSQLLLTALQTGRRAPLNDRSLLKAFLGYPLLTLHVMVSIHWQALKLWLKGAKYYSRPTPPSIAVERVDQIPQPSV